MPSVKKNVAQEELRPRLMIVTPGSVGTVVPIRSGKTQPTVGSRFFVAITNRLCPAGIGDDEDSLLHLLRAL